MSARTSGDLAAFRGHHVRDDLGAPLGWDIGFLVFGVLLILGGAVLARSTERESIKPRGASSRPRPG